MASDREGSRAMTTRARDLHRKLLERVLLRSDTQSVKDVFRRYDRERSGVLTREQFRALMRDHDFLDTDADLLLRHLGTKDQQSVSFHTFMGDVQLGAEQNYPSKNANGSASPKKVQQLTQLAETQKKSTQPQTSKTRGSTTKGVKPAVETIQDPMEAIRTKLRERVMGHSKSIREVFMEYDVDGSGFLDYEEFGRFMAKYKFAPEETQTIINYLDRDFSGTIDYDEFAAGLLFYRPPIPAPVMNSIRRKFDETLKNSKHTGRSRDLRAEFDHYDVDGNNSLDHQEFGALLIGFGIKLKAHELRIVLQEIDPDEDENIGYQTITKLLGVQEPAQSSHKKLFKDERHHNTSKENGEVFSTFNKYARNGSGKLDYDEFRCLMHDYGENDDREIDTLIDEIDKDGSGSISYTEFERAEYDHDGSGQLSYTDFRRLMLESGVKDNDAIDAMIDEIDEDGSGSINFEKFARVYDQRIKPSPQPKTNGKLMATLHKFNRDGNEPQHDESRLMRNSRIKNSEAIDKTNKGRNGPELSRVQDRNDHDAKSRLVALQEQELKFMERVLQKHNSIENAFREFDRDGRNEMDFEQFRDFMGQYGITDEANISMLLKRLDTDNSGVIDLQEFLSVFNAQRLARNKGAPQQVSNAKNASKINKASRLRGLEEKWIRGALTEYDSLQSAFETVDRDQDGEITRDEFRKLMYQYEIRDEEDIASLIKKLDVDGNGCIAYEEFASIFHETRNVRAARLRDLQIKWMKRVLSCHDSIESAFYQYDQDDNGELDHEEFSCFMKRYGIVKNDDIDTLIRRLDTDGSGAISFEEFSELESIMEIERELAQRMAHQARDLRLAFRKFDTNGNGLLEYKEFRSVLKSYRLPEMEIRKVIRHLDRDVSGFIDYKEFIAGFGVLKEGGGGATSPPKKVIKRAVPTKEPSSKPKPQIRRSPPIKPQRRSKTPLLETLKERMLDRILAIHGTVQGAFHEYDLDREGCLNETQFVKLVLDCEFSRDEAALLLDVFDRNQSGTIEYEEFLAQLVVKGDS
ncbi:Calmodulin [Phytophthora palmivora]|uniref:Calmodulin n=1 Tax=Phytophthora palmivora TaxID=4796 RepID=A0A2P4Y2J2_9STRA|nr:Calmodulin [Phytophthora palmivora]